MKPRQPSKMSRRTMRRCGGAARRSALPFHHQDTKTQRHSWCLGVLVVNLRTLRSFSFEALEILARDAPVRLRRPEQEDAALEREQQFLDPESDVADQKRLRGRHTAAEEIDEHELAHAFAGGGGNQEREQ